MSETPGTMNAIGWAVKQLHNGDRVRRSGWNGKGMWLVLIAQPYVPVYNVRTRVAGDEVYLKPSPWVAMRTATGEIVPWLCSQTDLLATDWELAE